MTARTRAKRRLIIPFLGPAVLVYVGVKLVRPADVRKLARFGKVPVIIYFASLFTIVTTNLLTGVIVGVGLSLLKLLYTITHLETMVVEDSGTSHLHPSGIGTFLGIPRIAGARRNKSTREDRSPQRRTSLHRSLVHRTDRGLG